MKALLLIDIQNDYFTNGANPLTGSEEAAVKAAKVLKHFRDNRLPIIHIQHISNWPGATFFLPGTHGAEIHEHVKPAEGETVFIKNFPNSFRETGLLEYLKSHDITELVVCGMMTHMCVDATVRAAKDFGFQCTVISDACATKDLSINGVTVDARNVHHSFLAALGYFYASIIAADNYLG